MVIMYRYTYSI